MNKINDRYPLFNMVIYHANCFDGVAAAWAATQSEFVNPRAVVCPVTHGDPPLDVRGKSVLVLDFAYPRSTMIGMASQAERLLVLDHHAGAAEDLAGLDFAIFDMERSGAGMAWDGARSERFGVGEINGWRWSPKRCGVPCPIAC